MPTLSLRLSPEQVRRLRARAAARGVAVEEYLADLASRDLADDAWEADIEAAAALVAPSQRLGAPAGRDAFYDDTL